MLFALSPVFRAHEDRCTARYAEEMAAVDAANRLRREGIAVRVRRVDGRGVGGEFTASALLIPMAPPKMRRAA